MPEPPQLIPFDAEEQRLYSELPPDVWAPHLISNAEPSHPLEETHFGCLYPRSCSFSHYPQLMTIGEGWNVDGPVNRELRLPAQLLLHHNGPVHRPHYCRCRTNLSVHLLHFALTREQDPEILELLRLRQQLTPNPEGALHSFSGRGTMASDLEVLTLIPTASHSAANRPSACWRSRSDVANRTTSSAMRGSEHGPLGFHVLNLPGIQAKFFWRWELKTLRTGASTRCSQFTLTIRLGLPGLSGSLPRHLIQLTTRWWSVDNSAPLFTRVSKTCGRRSADTTTKSIIDLWPKVVRYQVHLWATLCSNMVFVMASPWLAQKSNNKAPHTQIGQAVPPNHPPPGFSIVRVEVPQ